MIQSNLLQSLDKLFKPIRSRFSNIIQIGIIHKISSSNDSFQVSFSEGDTQEGIKKCEQFGFKSYPPAESFTLVLFPGGIRGVGFSISTWAKNEPQIDLKEGESAQYNHEGSYIALRKGGKFEFKNQENELIATLCDLLEKLEEMKKYLVMTSNAPPGVQGGPCTMIPPQIDLSNVRRKLKSFRVESK